MKNSLQIDSLDKKILSILSKNARIPFLEIARECNISGAAIHQRVNRLIETGIIMGSRIIVEPKRIGYETSAYIGIYLENAGLFKSVVQKLREIPEITQCHYTTGTYSMFAKLYTRNNEHLKNVLTDKIQAIEGISRTETFISLEAVIDRELPIENIKMEE